MRLPSRVIGTAAGILSEFYTHAEIDSRFLMCGYPENVPGGNKQQKVTRWLTAANESLENPVESFYELIEEFIEWDGLDRILFVRGGEKKISELQDVLSQAMIKSGLEYEAQTSSGLPAESHGFSNVFAGGQRIENLVGKNAHEVQPKVGAESNRMSGLGRKVFIVHGHHEALKHHVARTLEKLKLEPIVLSEQPNMGQTIIEKFEHRSDVAFAVVIMSCDDLARTKKDPNATELRPRARQNVMLELGYFFAKLGRDRVFVLCEDGVELPSDILGIVYEKADESGHWAYKLGREIKSAGIEVDLNHL